MMEDMSGCMATSGAIDAIWIYVEPYRYEHCWPKLVEDLRTDVCIEGLGAEMWDAGGLDGRVVNVSHG